LEYRLLLPKIRNPQRIKMVVSYLKWNRNGPSKEGQSLKSKLAKPNFLEWLQIKERFNPDPSFGLKGPFFPGKRF